MNQDPAGFQGTIHEAEALVHCVLTQASLNWVLEGFNANILAMGQSETGKSNTLLGSSLSSVSHPGLVVLVLRYLFKAIKKAGRTSGQNTYSVGISMWEVAQDTPRDLLDAEEAYKRHPNLQHSAPMEFTSIQVWQLYAFATY